MDSKTISRWIKVRNLHLIGNKTTIINYSSSNKVRDKLSKLNVKIIGTDKEMFEEEEDNKNYSGISMNIITVCGSLKYKNQIMKIKEENALRVICMLSIVCPTKQIEEYTKEEIEFAKILNKEKGEMKNYEFNN